MKIEKKTLKHKHFAYTRFSKSLYFRRKRKKFIMIYYWYYGDIKKKEEDLYEVDNYIR